LPPRLAAADLSCDIHFTAAYDDAKDGSLLMRVAKERMPQ
jgi:hypothetical protein